MSTEEKARENSNATAVRKLGRHVRPFWASEPVCTSATRCAGTTPCRCGYPTCRDKEAT